MPQDSRKTITFSVKDTRREEIRIVLRGVYNSLVEKGYHPTNQIVGYIVSEDPTYITNYNNARTIISKLDRDELLRCLVEDFIRDQKGTNTNE
ncbi:MAG: IreB family regulatory phosphoprotein [Clostridia bacterium]|nr:IreB family regulatory phosphoprotein [Clostridia bacterium]